MLSKAPPKFHNWYFPRLISMVGLPLLCICYLLSSGSFQRYGVMDYVVWDGKSKTGFIEEDAHKHTIDMFRKFTPLLFNGNVMHDAEAQNKLASCINQLGAKKDTINGICVSFGTHAKYKNLVSTLDECYQSANYELSICPWENRIFIWHPVPIKNLITLRGNFNDEVYFHPEESLTSIVIRKIKGAMLCAYQILKDFWPSALVFLLMITLLITKRRYYFINKAG